MKKCNIFLQRIRKNFWKFVFCFLFFLSLLLENVIRFSQITIMLRFPLDLLSHHAEKLYSSLKNCSFSKIMIRTFGAAVAGYPCFYLFLFDKFMVHFGCQNVQKLFLIIIKKIGI